VSTVGELIEECAEALADAGVVFGQGTDNAWDEATVLVLGVTELADDAANLGADVSAADAARIRALLKERIDARVPLAYLLGRCWFAGLEFLMQPGVVVPRSPIGQLLLAELSPWLTRTPERILDLCTGSGCIGITAAHVWPDAVVDLVELDPDTAALARTNVEHHELGNRVTVYEGSLYEPLPEGARYDLILANPPYVDEADMRALPAEFRQEPAMGLAGGIDGLELARRIIDQRGCWLTDDAVLVCEVGMSAAALSRAYPDLPFVWPEFESGGEGVFILLPDAGR
jgi:ribosomal protein L3 glutamine methyltransferase